MSGSSPNRLPGWFVIALAAAPAAFLLVFYAWPFVTLLVHGHTHRPAVHEVQMNGHTAVRIVLGDWYEQGSVLRWNERGYELASLSGYPE